MEANPANTFKITVSNQHKIQDVTEELGLAMDVTLGVSTRKAFRMRAITNRLRELKAQGGQPLVIIDEAENLTHGMIGLCKGIYDAINEQAAFVLIGTNELTDKLDQMERYGYKYPGVPQFRRRFKAGTVHLTPIDRQKHFDAFSRMCRTWSCASCCGAFVATTANCTTSSSLPCGRLPRTACP